MQRLKKERDESGDVTEWLLSLLALSVFGIALGAFALYTHQRKQALSLLKARGQHLSAANEALAALETQIMGERQQMEEHDRQLHDAIARHAATAAEAANLANRLATTLQEHEQLKRHLLESDEVVRKLRLLGTLAESEREKRHREFQLNASERDHLFQAVDHTSNRLVVRLRQSYPALTDADVLLCVLLRLELAPADIAFLCGCSEDTLRKRKFRLKKERLMLPPDGLPL